jgi:hypothetical protein
MKSFLALVSLAFATSIGSAQTPAAAPVIGLPAAPTAEAAPSPERAAAAKVLMTNMRFSETLAKVLDVRKDQAVRYVDQTVSVLPKGAASDAEIAAYKADMLKTYNSVMSPEAAVGGMVNVYASLFTVDELKGMSDFYASPAGQALVGKTIELQQKSGEVLQKQLQIVVPQLQAKAKAFADAHTPKPAPSAAAPAPAAAPSPSTK